MTGPGRRRSGFTLVEVLLVTAVLGIVARIAIPNVDHLLTRARAAEVLAEVSAVRLAAYEAVADGYAWPPDTPAGQVPEALRPFLPDGFDFAGDGYTLDWESWSLPAGLPGRPGVRRLTGVTVQTDDRGLADALRGLVGDGPWFVLGGSAYTFLIEPD